MKSCISNSNTGREPSVCSAVCSGVFRLPPIKLWRPKGWGPLLLWCSLMNCVLLQWSCNQVLSLNYASILNSTVVDVNQLNYECDRDTRHCMFLIFHTGLICGCWLHLYYCLVCSFSARLWLQSQGFEASEENQTEPTWQTVQMLLERLNHSYTSSPPFFSSFD